MTTKPKLSVIRARIICLCSWNPPSDKDYLLDLVDRMGTVIREMKKELLADQEPSSMPLWEEARALLKELKQ